VVAVAHHKVFKRQLGGLSLLKGRMKPRALEGEDLKLTVLRKNEPVIDSAMPRLRSERGRAARSHAVIEPADDRPNRVYRGKIAQADRDRGELQTCKSAFGRELGYFCPKQLWVV
jgi:hypothetical protein